MQYLIMLLIVIGLAFSDIVTGCIKALVKGTYRSAVMRKGGLNKLGEATVMLTVIGLEAGMERLGKYYDCPELAGIAGAVTAVSVFLYIVVMELVSILENYGETNPDAWFAKVLAKWLRNLQNREDDNEKF